MPASAIVFLACVLLGGLIVVAHRRRRSSRPPGPPGLPIIGNILDVLGPDLWETSQEWEKEHGGIIFLDIIGTPIVIINDYEIAVELLEKRSSIYSSRSTLPMTTDFQKWTWMTPTIPYGDLLKRHRQIFHQFFQLNVIDKYKSLQEAEAHKLLLNLLESPERYHEHVRRESGAITMMVAYGHEVKDENDAFISLAEEALSVFGDSALPYLVNFIPALIHLPDWLPFMEFKKVARRGYELSQRMLNVPFNLTKERVLKGQGLPSMATQLLEKVDKEGHLIEDSVIAGTTATVYAAGSDTTVSAILTFILAMVLHPDVQRRAQEELHDVLGANVLPTFSDKARLPYIDAILKECIRWQAVAPFAAPHSPIVDDVYGGHIIKAGTAVCPNVWAMLRDAKEYPNPDTFLPERWLPKDGTAVPRHPMKVAFGFGRRICPGRYMAENSIFITISLILATFDIGKSLNEDGTSITPDVKYVTSLLRHPKPFKCTFTPRSKRVESLIGLHADQSSA